MRYLKEMDKKLSQIQNGKKLTVRQQAWKGMNWISRQKRLAIYLRDNLQCCYCGKSLLNKNIKLTLDHIIPVCEYDGKAQDAQNIVTCCSNCNFRKQDLSLSDFSKIIAAEKGINPIWITNHVKKQSVKLLDTKQAGIIVRSQVNWTNVYSHLKKINSITL